jgi:hypothetical protein
MDAIFGKKAAAAGAASPSAAPSATLSAASPVDVAAILDKATAAQKQKLNWRKSIVDLMKVLDLDSSLTAQTAGQRTTIQRQYE